MAQHKKTILREEELVDRETGEIVRCRHTVQFEAEPAFVKLYLDCLGVFTNMEALNKSMNDMLVETLKYMTYADQDQTLYLNSAIKKQICQKTGKTLSRYNQALTLWVKEGVLQRIERSTYKVNPWIFGKGDWRDIERLRATFDFSKGSVTVDKKMKTSKNEEQDNEEASEASA